MKDHRHTIVYLIDSLSFGGAEKQLTLLAESLPGSFTPVVVSLSENTIPFGDHLTSKGIEVIVIPRRSHNDWSRLWRVTRLLRENRADIVHGFLDAANGYAYVAARMLRKPVILSLRNEKLRVSGAKAAVLSWMLRHSDGVLVNSNAGVKFLETKVRVANDKIVYIRNWVDPEKGPCVRTLPPPDDPWTIGFVGRFAKQKRLHLLINAFQRVLEHAPGRLLLMGSGSEHGALVEQTQALGISEHVEFIDPDLNIETTLKRLHAFVIASGFEGLPNAAIEALSMGIPIVSTPVGDLRELIIEGKTGYFFEDDSPESMAKTIVDALSDRELLETALDIGPTFIEEEFSIERALNRLIPVYSSLVST
ncbi:MAG: glycosyltransferase [Candidatus Latescibacterota bacterium]|nr:MAG: glycosyltransferase [Candidatus Latescibacterota bacterium]